jgi:hypothetical protein
MRAWIVLALAAGCSGKPDCETAVSGAVDRMVADAVNRMPPAAEANMVRVKPAMKHAVIDACLEDHWAQPVIDCVAHAGTQKALDACDKQLTKAQHDSEHKRTDEVLKLAIMPLGVGLGSDLGSAGGGSN